jgi:uncharacterized HAD superfamily protein
MDKPRIGVDIDGTICDWVVVAVNIIAMEADILIDQIYDYLRQGVPDWLEIYFKDAASREGPYKICPAYSDARVYLNMLDRLGYPISYITHRAEEMRYVTESWLDKSGFPRYLDVYYTDGKSKVDYARELELDFFVEDRLSVAEELVDVVPEVILITRPWNELKNSEKPILRCSNWFEIYDEITETY